ncbi:Na(+)/H(+) antiporter NhaP [Roseibaca ekhonensis]|jgi:CPA1 family monovalent cation:H+ antiporter|uniref:Na(+)/H(+) antiporter NhaP n=1 Tax=Roseinatronobacter ekhonensis TaxID=254356 RepID=A0A3B0MD19_9RHOB|nr:sodium:proton antiporter [Roseibaca ekhonensis]SUZ33513.1 Na(+)/H(+) antiporter NhaP [Roseibaca ekhonensis]
MSQFELIAILLVLTATFSWVNFRLAFLPHTIGLLVMGLGASLVVIGAEAAMPGLFNYEGLTALLRQVHFQQTVLEGMLAFLLFAGALHVDVVSLRSRALTIGTMASLGVVVSTAIIGCVVWAAADLLGVAISLPWALVFGALISPTDPVAVLATLKEVKVPADLKILMTGETLFNDGVGVVLFAVLVHAAQGDGFDAFQVGQMFVVEALGGAALGAVTGYGAYRAMRAIDDYSIEVLISLALVVGTYAIASRLVVSGPLAVVVAGLLVGSRGPRDALSEETQRYLFGFWTLIDEMLNSVLFLLIGLEVLVLRFEPAFGWLMMLAVPLVLVARLAAVSGPVLLLGLFRKFGRGTIPVLTWGGLRGGISVALALSLPEVEEKSALLAATYAVVVFTLIVQGLSLRAVIKRVVRS